MNKFIFFLGLFFISCADTAQNKNQYENTYGTTIFLNKKISSNSLDSCASLIDTFCKTESLILNTKDYICLIKKVLTNWRDKSVCGFTDVFFDNVIKNALVNDENFNISELFFMTPTDYDCSGIECGIFLERKTKPFLKNIQQENQNQELIKIYKIALILSLKKNEDRRFFIKKTGSSQIFGKNKNCIKC